LLLEGFKLLNLSTIILTKNEEKNIAKAILSIKKISSRIIVVDSFSNDKTTEIAKSLGAEIYLNEFINYGVQFQWALDNCNIDTKWVFRFDADEELSKSGEKEIEFLLKKHDSTNVNGLIFNLEITFLGKKLKYGGAYPFRKLCIFKFGKAFMEKRFMDEQIILTDGKSIKMKSISYHNDYKDLTSWIDKHNKYSTRAVFDYFENVNKKQIISKLDNSSILRRFFKYFIYYKLPKILRSRIYFIYRYYFQFGFLDGYEGYIYAFLQAYWYRVLIDAKIYELKKQKL